MPSGSVRLYGPAPTSGTAYTGRWVLTVSSFTIPGGTDGFLGEFDFEIPIVNIAGAYIGFYVGNWTTTDPANMVGGFTFDSASPPGWSSSHGAQVVNVPGGFTDWNGRSSYGGITEMWDGSGPSTFDLGFTVTIDAASDSSWFLPAPYEVKVVAQDGTPYGTLTNGKLARVSWELNGPGAAEISLATTDSDASLMVPGREVQVYYQGGTDPIWWGPIVRPQAELRESSWQCAGLLWYFTHRFMGRADRVNQLTNGDFESGETGWSFSGVTHSVNTNMTYVVSGTKSEKLTGATADHSTYAYQTYTHPAGGYPGGDYLTAAVYVYITSADYVGPALDKFGLVLRHKNAGGTVINEGGSSDSGSPAIIDDNTPRDQWVLLRTGVPFVQEGDTVDILLFPPHGVAYFDLATLTFMESLSFGYPPPGEDVTTIIETIVNYAQDRTPPGFSHGKSDLNIDPAGSATGTLVQAAYQFAEHRNIADAILEFVRQGVCDIDIAITATTRIFTVYPKSTDSRTPKLGKGSLYGTTLELDVNLSDFSYAQDLEQAASSVVLLGPGDGPDRPEGGATDTSLLGGAFTLEVVEQAPDNATIGQLDDRAQERLDVAVRPDILQVTTLPGAGIIGNLTVGDTATVVISVGAVAINAIYRAVRIEADLLKDQATITMNAVPA
jgi:hypothetical protein